MSAATRAGYEPDKLIRSIMEVIAGKKTGKDAHDTLLAAVKFIDAEGRAVELSTADSNKSRKHAAMLEGKPWWWNHEPQHWYNAVESERRALNDGESGPYNTSR